MRIISEVLIMVCIMGIFVAAIIVLLPYIPQQQTPSVTVTNSTQVYFVIQNGNWTAIIPSEVILSESGIMLRGLNFSSSNFTEVSQWAMNQTR